MGREISVAGGGAYESEVIHGKINARTRSHSCFVIFTVHAPKYNRSASAGGGGTRPASVTHSSVCVALKMEKKKCMCVCIKNRRQQHEKK